ncbi:hypothetical protein [Microbispora sp. H10836]|uniref:hypothetical protein n=1 Tax=Microbispora sp. H10836 TaxID=2729106 RepID=UPI0014747F69|nr:hypothetical protein [Microbispora sp. H10836]
MAGSNSIVKRFAVSIFIALTAAASAGAMVSVASASHAHARTVVHRSVQPHTPAGIPSPSPTNTHVNPWD